MRRWTQIAIAVSLIATSASANRYADNPAFPIADRRFFPQFLPLVQLERLEDALKRMPGTEADIRATGFNISPCMLVTNHHVVYGDDMSPVRGVEYKMVIFAGVKKESQKFLGISQNTRLIHQHEREEDGRGDWQIIASSACLANCLAGICYRISHPLN